MLSSVLNSDRAIEVNIAIMRTFVHLRQYLATHQDLELEDVDALNTSTVSISNRFTAVSKSPRNLHPCP